MPLSGLLTSCATPDASRPIAASRSAWKICRCAERSSSFDCASRARIRLNWRTTVPISSSDSGRSAPPPDSRSQAVHDGRERRQGLRLADDEEVEDTRSSAATTPSVPAPSIV